MRLKAGQDVWFVVATADRLGAYSKHGEYHRQNKHGNSSIVYARNPRGHGFSYQEAALQKSQEMKKRVEVGLPELITP